MKRETLRRFIPPIVLEIKNSFRKKKDPEWDILWEGDHKSWADAQALTSGYDSIEVLQNCKKALLKVKHGEAAYERDGVLFNEVEYDWGVLSALLHIALRNNGKLSVIDFGGSLGSTYFQNRKFLESLAELNWCIVEQKGFTDAGKECFEDGSLKFFYTIEEAITNYPPDTVLMSGVLQCIEHPASLIAQVIALNPTNIIISRTAFIESTERITVQTVPEILGKASYPCRFFNEEQFLGQFSDSYEIFSSFDSYADPQRLASDGKRMYWKGYYLKLRKGC